MLQKAFMSGFNVSLGEKKCSGCKKVKHTDEFPWANKKQGLKRYWCKDCVHQNYLENKEKVKDRSRKWAKSNRTRYLELKREIQASWVKRNPEKAFAHRLARIHQDKIKKNACEICGSVERLHMHHPDYSEPLFVVTLCNICHVKQHHA